MRAFCRHANPSHLATCYIFQRNDKQAIPHLKKAIPLTVPSQEYHIYTLMNLALLFRSKDQEDKAYTFYNRSLKLAEKGNNILALHQIKHYWTAFNRVDPLLFPERY